MRQRYCFFHYWILQRNDASIYIVIIATEAGAHHLYTFTYSPGPVKSGVTLGVSIDASVNVGVDVGMDLGLQVAPPGLGVH